MYTANKQRYLRSKVIGSHALTDKQTTCVVRSDELSRLDELLQKQFPLIYDLLGGVEGLFSAIAGSDIPANEYSNCTEQTYEELSKAAYGVIEDVVTDQGDFTENGFVVNDIETEFVSWHFNDYLVEASVLYRNILHDLLCGFNSKSNDVMVNQLMKSPVAHTYYIVLMPR